VQEAYVARAWLFVIALSIGVGVVALESVLFDSLTGRHWAFGDDVEPVNVLIVAIPYLGLALAGARRLRPWIVGLALTLSLWGYALYSGVSYQWNPDGTGADIGLGLIMLASPFIISPIVLAIHALQQRGGRETKAGTADRFSCPVCGYGGLAEPAYDEHGCSSHEICPSCGTQFGYHDCSTSHAELRTRWLEGGARWRSQQPQPENWSALAQLKAAGLLSD
jgi:hypothetical protein